MSLDSEEVKLNGHFALYENDLISGRLSLVLSRELMETSAKFKTLLIILGRDIREVPFDFQVSGLLETMNFKWLESDFKRRVQKTLPAFMERGIERKLEEAMKSISAKEEAPQPN